MATKQLVDATELSGILRVSRQKVWRLVRYNHLPYYDLGRGSMRFDVNEVLELLRENGNGSGDNRDD